MGIFGPSTKEVYAELAETMGTEVIKGSGFAGPRIERVKDGIRQYIDTYTQSTGQSSIVYTRIQMIFVAKQPFHLKVYKKGLFTDLGKALGMQDIEIGRTEFDDAFVIKGNDERIVKTLISDYDVMNTLSNHSKWILEIKDRDPLSMKKLNAGEHVLSLHIIGIVKEMEIYKTMLDMVSRVHDIMLENDICDTQLPTTVLYKTKA